MPSKLLVPVLLLCVQLANAQFDRMDQPSLGSYYYAHIRTSDSTWWFVGQEEVSNSFLSNALLRNVDENGAVINERYFQVPGYELAYFSDVAELPDSSLILSGVASFGCDFGMFETFVVRLLEDSVLWQRHYGIEALRGIAVNDSTIQLCGYDTEGSGPSMLVLDHDGDSLSTFPLDMAWVTGMADLQHGALVFGQDRVQRVLPNGPVASALIGLSVVAALEINNGNILVLTSDSLVILDAALQQTGVAASFETGYNETLLQHGNSLFVVSSDSVLRFGPELVLNNSYAIGHPDGYSPVAATMQDGLLTTSGTFYCGAAGAAVRSVLMDAPASLPMDMAFRGLAVDSSTVHQEWWQGGTYITGQFWVNGWLVNEGELPVASVMIDQVFPFGICT